MRYPLGFVLAACLAAGPALSAVGAARPQSDLDAFMAKVLAARDENWKKLQQYILDEVEKVAVRGPSRLPIWGEQREYRWYIRDGFFVRSPLKANGVTIGEKERLAYEERFLKRVKEREKKDKEAPERPAPPETMPGDIGALLSQSRQPEFVDSAYFLKFKFEQGKYALVGREKLDGFDVLRIEYYPAKLFAHEQDQEKKRQEEKKKDRGEDYEAQIEKMMNKVSLVTIWVEPKAHQIIKYTFDNVNLDFLPAAWLLRVTDLKASMTMSQPFPDVWLPRDVDFFFGGMVAIGTFDVNYHIDYKDYQQATTSGRIKKIGGRR
ncbi:MAG TPA: hypothetical protein VFV98_16505 [Vicinamibacterales bacterium]|nr:hypothetical protein [Vicinamibacterales bacterium]